MEMRTLLLPLIFSMLFSCSTNEVVGGVIGGTVGTVAGAAITLEKPLEGAAGGAAAGAITGTLIAKKIEEDEQKRKKDEKLKQDKINNEILRRKSTPVDEFISERNYTKLKSLRKTSEAKLKSNKIALLLNENITFYKDSTKVNATMAYNLHNIATVLRNFPETDLNILVFAEDSLFESNLKKDRAKELASYFNRQGLTKTEISSKHFLCKSKEEQDICNTIILEFETNKTRVVGVREEVLREMAVKKIKNDETIEKLRESSTTK